MPEIAQKQRRIMRIALVTLVTLLVGGTILFRILEDWTWIQSFYFTVITLTTVGYGDLTPTTDATRLVTAFFILFGVGIVAAVISNYGSLVLRRRVETKFKDDETNSQQ